VTRTLRRVSHDLVLIGRVAAEPLPESSRSRLAGRLTEFGMTASAFLRGLGAAFAQRKPPPDTASLNAAIGSLAAELEILKDSERLATLGFALEHLQRNLADLTRRAAEFARGPAAAEIPTA
jgi:hypothetical protein